MIASSSPYGLAGSVEGTAPDGTRVTGSYSAGTCRLDTGELCTTFTLPEIDTCLPWYLSSEPASSRASLGVSALPRMRTRRRRLLHF